MSRGLLGRARCAHTVSVVPWLVAGVAVAVATAAVLVASGMLSVRRYSGSHLVAHVAFSRRGLYLSCGPEGMLWRLRLRPWRAGCEDLGSWGEPPSNSGVREPRRPLGPGPLADGIKLDPPTS
jgi:hypothetical protein